MFSNTSALAARMLPLFLNLPILSYSDTEKISERVERLRGCWIKRSGDGFYTLGRATYLDCEAEPSDQLFQIISVSNEVMATHFTDLYELIRNVLGQALGAPVNLTNTYALPGFHLFFGDRVNAASAADPHYDMQYKRLKWADGLDEAPPISFTLPVSVPRCGAGLEYWHDIVGNENRTAQLETYSVGTLTVHTRHVLHRIANLGPVASNELRYTLQGHGRKLGGSWLLYW
jgi:hypothetical protein